MIRVALVVLAALAISSSAQAHNPRPMCAPQVKHCHITKVSYSWTQHGHDQFGNQYVRTCHVPAHHKRWCGAWQAVTPLRSAQRAADHGRTRLLRLP